MRFFLAKTFGSSDIDEGLLAYDYASAHQPGAEHAPFCFIAGHLFPTDATRLYERLRLPVWMVHGERGDFVDYRLVPRVADRPNWRVDTLPTGAFPHFERPEAVAAGYDAFLASISFACRRLDRRDPVAEPHDAVGQALAGRQVELAAAAHRVRLLAADVEHRRRPAQAIDRGHEEQAQLVDEPGLQHRPVDVAAALDEEPLDPEQGAQLRRRQGKSTARSPANK